MSKGHKIVTGLLAMLAWNTTSSIPAYAASNPQWKIEVHVDLTNGRRAMAYKAPDGSDPYPYIVGPRKLSPEERQRYLHDIFEMCQRITSGMGLTHKQYEITVPRNYSLDRLAEELGTVSGERVTWQDLYAQNKQVVGENPDLIQPGMKLRFSTIGQV